MVTVLIVANIILGASLFFSHMAKRNKVAREERKMLMATATNMDKRAVMRKEDFVKLSEAGRTWRRTKSVTDADLDWCLTLLKHDPNPDKPNNKVLAQSMLLLYMMNIKNYTPSQKGVIYRFCGELLKGDGGTLGGDYIIAMNLAKSTQDTRVIPLLLPLAEHSDPKIKQDALNTIQTLQEPPRKK